ncbi:MAG: MerR family transcriptional regulator [bacterium]|nr:MerR family transcriptional regulator [bacterium]
MSNTRNKPIASSLNEIPNKIYYSISEVSDYTGVEPHVLRYWETKFTRLNPKRVGGNQRKYTRNDLELLYEIVHLLYQEGYTLDGAERKLRMGLQAVRAEREAIQQERAAATIGAVETAPPAVNPAPVLVEEASEQPLSQPAEETETAPPPNALSEIKSELLQLLDILDGKKK